MMRMIEFAFADINGGREILGAEDEYLTRLTAGERLLRTKKSTFIAHKEFADFLNGCVLPWTEKEINRLNGISWKDLLSMKSSMLFPEPFPVSGIFYTDCWGLIRLMR